MMSILCRAKLGLKIALDVNLKNPIIFVSKVIAIWIQAPGCARQIQVCLTKSTFGFVFCDPDKFFSCRLSGVYTTVMYHWVM